MAPSRRPKKDSQKDEDFDTDELEGEQESSDAEEEAGFAAPRVGRRSRRSAKDQGQAWSAGELKLLLQSVEKQLQPDDPGGQRVDWLKVAGQLSRRTAKQCREKWRNDHRPGVRKGEWSQQEELVLAKAHAKHGSRWLEVVKYLPRRSENCIKNRW
jgi:hypothetical protein